MRRGLHHLFSYECNTLLKNGLLLSIYARHRQYDNMGDLATFQGYFDIIIGQY